MVYQVTKVGSSRFRRITDIIAELKKVIWLSRREAAYLTFLVLVISVSVGLVLGAIDYGFAHLINKLFLGG